MPLFHVDGGLKISDLDNSKCIVCNKYFKHKILNKQNNEIDIITGHTGCFNLINKRNKIKSDLLNVEYDLFCKNERFANIK